MKLKYDTEVIVVFVLRRETVHSIPLYYIDLIPDILPERCVMSLREKNRNKLELNLAKLKSSLFKVADEV